MRRNASHRRSRSSTPAAPSSRRARFDAIESLEARRLLSAVATKVADDLCGCGSMAEIEKMAASPAVTAERVLAPSAGAGAASSIGGPEAVITVGPVVNISRAVGNQTEADIAINPTNTQQVFAVSNLTSNGLFSSRSSDGGVTWTTINIATGSSPDGLPTACCDARVDYDNFGNLWMVYLGPGGNGIFVARSLNNGASWTLVNSRTGSWDNPAIDAGHNNDVWVEARGPGGVVGFGWRATGFGTIDPSIGTGGFSATQVVPTTGTTGNFGDIAVLNDGSVLITYTTPSGGQGPANNPVWRDPDGFGPLGFQGAGGGTTTPLFNPVTNVGGFDFIPAQDGRSVDSEPSFAVAPPNTPFAGRVYFTYTQEKVAENNDLDIVLRWSDNGGTTWTAEKIINDDNQSIIRSQFLQQIAVDPVTGAIALSWHDARNDNGVLPNGTNTVANDDAQFWGAVSGDGGETFENFPIMLGWSNDDRANNGIDYGDWTGSDFYNGIFHAVWADNSQGANGITLNPDPNTFDLATSRVLIQGVGGNGIFGQVYDDADGDSTRDAGEAGLGGVTVYLDIDNSGTLNGGDITATTSTGGSYGFSPIADGTYTVRAVTPAGRRPTQPVGGSYTATINSGTPIAVNQNFGFVNPRFAGTVFTDSNDNGVQDGAEAGRSGVTVYLDLDDSGTLNGSEPSVVTNAQGAYEIAGLTDGTYTGRMVLPAGTRQTAPTSAGGAFNFTISPTSLASANNLFGVTSAVRIQGVVYNDQNGNGARDGLEPGINNARVYLDTNNNGSFDNQNFDFAQNIPLPLPDDRTTRFSNLTIAGTSSTVANIGVRINISHTFIGDLDIFLISPAGTRIELTTDNGSSTNGMNVTLLASAANSVTTWPTSDGPAVTGTWRPEGNLTSLNGQSLDGLWRLEITDDAGGDSGTLNTWSLFQTSVEPNQLTPASGQYSFTPLAAGNFVVRQVPLGGGFSFTQPVGGVYNFTAAVPDILQGDFGNSAAFTSADGFYVRLNPAGDTIEIFQGIAPSGSPAFSLPRASTNVINLAGTPNADQLYVDLVNGNPIPADGINFAAGGGSDTAVLLGTASADDAKFVGSSIQTGGRSINYTSTENIRFEGGAGNDSLESSAPVASPTFLGQGDRNSLLVSQGNWTYALDAATQNAQIDITVAAGGSLLLGATQHLTSLTVQNAGTAELGSGDLLLRTEALTVGPTGRLDLADGAMIVDYASASPLASVVAGLTSGYDAGGWAGDGINSSVAARTPGTGLGYAEASAIFTTFPATFVGEAVDSSTVLVGYTLYGDANLDLTVVNIGDFSALAAAFNSPGGWSSGNFNYDALVDIADFSLLAAAFNQTVPSSLPRAAAGAAVPAVPGAAGGLFATRRIGDEADRVAVDVLV